MHHDRAPTATAGFVAVPAAMPAPVAEPPALAAHASLADQQACDTIGRKAADKWLADYKTNSEREQVYGESVTTHMNAAMGECLVSIFGSITYTLDYQINNKPSYRIDPQIGVVFDAIGKRTFAYYYWDNPNKVVAPPAQECWVEGTAYTTAKPCLGEDDWYEATRKLMTE